MFGCSLIELGDLTLQHLDVLSQPPVLQVQLAVGFSLHAQLELHLAKLPNLPVVLTLPTPVILIQILRLPLHLLDVLLHLPGLPHRDLGQLLEMPDFLIRRDELHLQTFQLLHCRKKGTVFLLLPDVELQGGVRSTVDRCLGRVQLELDCSPLKLQAAVILEKQLDLCSHPLQLGVIQFDDLLFFKQFPTQRP